MVPVMDDRTRDGDNSDFDHQRGSVPLNEPFIVGGEALMYQVTHQVAQGIVSTVDVVLPTS